MLKAFIQSYHLLDLKKKLLLIYLLNVTDIIFTKILLQTGYYLEANKFMERIVNNALASAVVKVFLPALLIIYICSRLNKATDSQLKKSNCLISGLLIAYSGINLMHILWFMLLPVWC